MLRWLFELVINLPFKDKTRAKIINFAGAKIKAIRIRRHIFIDFPKRLSVGEGTFINYYCHMHLGASGKIKIGKNVFIGPDVKLCCVSHEIGREELRAGNAKSGDIIIEDGSWIGIGAIILPGVTIGKGSIIAAGSVVKENVEPNSLVGGVPAKLIRYLECSTDDRTDKYQ